MQTVSEAKKQFNALISKPETTLISKNGKPAAAVVPYELYQKMYRTWKRQRNAEAIKRAQKALNGESRILSETELRQLMEEAKHGKSGPI